ncbi:MAG: phosphatidylserine/phosphatidylglycerophosphate/cardiolipin synthase family protein [Candidatus Binatia bacterium]
MNRYRGRESSGSKRQMDATGADGKAEPSVCAAGRMDWNRWGLSAHWKLCKACRGARSGMIRRSSLNSLRIMTPCCGALVISLALGGCGSLQKYHRIGDEKNGKGPPVLTVARATLGATLVATARAPVASTRTGVVMLRARVRALVSGAVPLPKASGKDGSLPAQAGGEEFESYLDRENLPARTTGTVEILVGGSSFFPLFLNSIAGARIRIDVRTYIFDNDDFAVQVADALKSKSMEVPVRVLFDGHGSMLAATKPPPSPPEDFQPPKRIGRYLTEGSNVEVRRTSNPYFVSDHTKLHIVDGETAFVGGMNVGREYRSHWHDMMTRVNGPVVADLAALFERQWRAESWWKGRWGSRRSQGSVGDSTAAIDPGELQPLRILLTDASRGKRDIVKAALIAFRSAKRRIWIQTPYFSCNDVALELERALARGVDVRIIIPGDNDTEIMHSNNLAEMRSLKEKGAKVYAYPGMTHLKAMISDDWVMFGSANYDTLSMRINRELNLATSDPRTVDAIANQVFIPDFGQSHPLTLEHLKEEKGAVADVIGDQL